MKLELDSYQVHSVGIGADARGEASLSVEWKGWRINPQVCYDLR